MATTKIKDENLSVMKAPLGEILDAAEGVVSTSKEWIGVGVEQASDAAKSAEKALSKGMKQTVRFIKKYPVEFGIAALGVGTVLGWLLRPKNKIVEK